MISNPELDLAYNFIKKTDRNVFLTGKAGTGKTTFLHKIKTESFKRMVVVAPTGVAAINAKGVTIHSFFQMPFGPFLPDAHYQSSENQRKFNKTKIDIIKSLDLVIIDEISMVRADLLDGIDQVLRRYKNKNKVFGGTQVLMIGDLQQLAPVVRPNEWSLLRNYYNTVYFFSSNAFKKANTISIELKHIYRQENSEFIAILNEVRNNRLTEKSIKILNERYQPNFEPKKQEGYITLTTHNRRADAINSTALDKLKENSHFFFAKIEGKFNEQSFPTDKKLALKKGAQVMFIKNDSSYEKRYFNGKIGVITYLSDDEILVKCDGDDEQISVTPETWENINYTLNSTTKEIKENIQGSFSQIPLRLAWAITIHKSQGLTFDKVIIDAEASFAHGQTYVALSRCTSLQGIVFKTPIKSTSIISDVTVNSFTQKILENIPDNTILAESKKAYQLNLITELFNFHPFLYPISRLLDIYYKHKTSIKGTVLEHLQTCKEKGIIPLLKVSNGFKNQLTILSKDVISLEESNQIQERFKKAIAYFSNQTQLFIKAPLDSITFSSENKTVKKDIEKQIQRLYELLFVKIACFIALKKEFKSSKYLRTRAKAMLEIPKKKRKPLISNASTSHPFLFDELREYRKQISLEEGIPPFQIFTQETLFEMSEKLPTSLKQLKAIKGMGKIRVQKYGKEILQSIIMYCNMNEIPVQKDQKTTKKPTKQISLQMFTSGFSIDEIAKQRELTTGTITGHLLHFLPTREIMPFDLISKNQFEKIKKVIKKTPFVGLSELKEKVGKDFSYTELRIVLAILQK